MCQKLKAKVWNYLATHGKKLSTHSCVVTPRLETTPLDDTRNTQMCQDTRFEKHEWGYNFGWTNFGKKIWTNFSRGTIQQKRRG
jgi:hypothetical protein